MLYRREQGGASVGLAFYSHVVKSQQIGVVIRAARETAGMSQQSLAHLAGTTVDGISAIEIGKRNPGWPTLARIAAVLQIPASALDGAIEYESQLAAARSKAPKSPQEAKALREQQERMRKRHAER